MRRGRNGAPSPLEHGPLLQALFLPFRSDLSGRPGNVFLDGTLTPPALPVLALIGVAFGLARRGRRLPTLALVAVGVGLTATGLALGRINLMRYQLAAQVFYALLAGQGLAALGALLARVPPRRPRLNAGLLAVALGASVALDPGLVGQVFTPPLERRFLGEALAQVADDCVILTPEPIPGRRAELPTYLSRELGLHHSWGTVRPGKLPPAVTRAPCVVYYRPLECWDFQQGPGAPEEPGRTFRAGCADLEARLALQPLVRRDLPALPDQYDVYRADRLEVGFFKVLGPR